MDIESYLKKFETKSEQRKDFSSFFSNIKKLTTDLKNVGFEVAEGDDHVLISPFTCNPESLFSKEESMNITKHFFDHKNCSLQSAFLIPEDNESFSIITRVRFPAEYQNETKLLDLIFSNFSFGERIISMRFFVRNEGNIEIWLRTHLFYDSCTCDFAREVIQLQQAKAFKIIKCLAMYKKDPSEDILTSILDESQSIAFQDSEPKPWIKYLPSGNKTTKNYEEVVKFLGEKKSPYIKIEYFDFDVLFLKAMFKNEEREFLVIIKQYNESDLTSICLSIKNPDFIKAMKLRKFTITMVDNLTYFSNEYAEFSLLQPEPCFINYFYTPRDNSNYLARLYESIENLVFFAKLQLEVSVFDVKD